MALSAHVDALFLVVRLNRVRRPMLSEVRRLLETAPSLKLGFVLTGAESQEGYGYGHPGSYPSSEHLIMGPSDYVKRARVLLLDPVPIFRTEVRNVLTRESDFEVVEAGSYEEARALEPLDIALDRRGSSSTGSGCLRVRTSSYGASGRRRERFSPRCALARTGTSIRTSRRVASYGRCGHWPTARRRSHETSPHQ